MKTFEEVRKFLADVPFINRGGCAISALAMKLWLKKNENIDVEIHYLYSRFNDLTFKNNEQYFNKESDYLDSCAHAVIKYEEELMDCLPIMHGNCYRDTTHILTEVEVRVSIAGDNWNDLFDRTKWVPIIEENLNINLEI